MPHGKPHNNIKRIKKKINRSIKPDVPRFNVRPPPAVPKMMKRRGAKNLMPKAFRKNVRIH